MRVDERDKLIIGKIVQYCDEIRKTIDFFGESNEEFGKNTIFQNACSMCIVQIGELAGRLSENAREQISDIPWTLIRGMRNEFAHHYGAMNVETTWYTLVNDIPVLRKACEKHLEE